MGWGNPLTTRRRIQADNTVVYNAGNTTTSLQHVGLIKGLNLRYNATYAYTKSAGGSTQDAMGPFNALSNLTILANGIGMFANLPAWMLYLFDLVHYNDTFWNPAASVDANVVQEAANGNVYSFPAVPGASGNITLLWQLRFPFTIEIAGIKEIGLFVLQNDEINVQVTPQFNSTPANATALVGPYDIAGGDTFALGTPTLDITREFYAVPANEKDYPTVGWFHQLEAQLVPMTATMTEIAHPKGGIILRAFYQAVSGGTSLYPFALGATNGINRLKWVYGSNEIPYDEAVTDVLFRQRYTYGRDLPVGAMVHDFFGYGGKSLKDTYDTQQYQNLRTQIFTSTTPAAGSYVWVLRERLIPIGNVAESLY